MPVQQSQSSSICLEGLENRQLMSTSFINGVLRVTGTNNADRVDVDQYQGDIYVFENNVSSRIVPASQVNAIAFDAYGGADIFKATPAVTTPITVYAGAGDDIVETGSGTDYVFGGLGKDYIDGGAGDDRLEGAEGNDTIVGGIGNDDISGSSNNDLLYGGADNDTIHGWDGDDSIYGDAGRDVLYGDNGYDMVTGGAGNDMMYGGADNDRMFAKDGGRDVVDGGTGNDTAQIDKGYLGLFGTKDLVTSVEYKY